MDQCEGRKRQFKGGKYDSPEVRKFSLPEGLGTHSEKIV